MKKLLLIFLLLPLFAYPQAEKRHRSIIIDSVKALNGGIIDIKDSASFEKPVGIGGTLDASALLTLTDTAQGLLVPRMTATQRDNIVSPATGLLVFDTDSNAFLFFDSSVWMKLVDDDGGVGDMLKSVYDTNNDGIVNNSDTVNGDIDASQIVGLTSGDSSFVTLQVDTIKAFSNTTIQFIDTTVFQRSVQIDSALTVTNGQTTLKGIDATSGNFALLVEDNVGTDIFQIRNDGRFGMGPIITATRLAVKGFGNGASTFSLVVRNSDGDELFNIADDGDIGFGGFSTKGDIAFVEKSRVVFDNTSITTSDIVWFQSGSFAAGFQYTHASTKFDFFIGGAGSSADIALTINADGDVGIGTTSSVPSARLHIKGVDATSANFALKVQDDGGLELLSIRNDGNIGIGTTTPSKRLDVNGTVNISDTLFQNGVVIFRDCVVIADEASINLPDATTQDLKVWVDGDDEWAIGAIQSDGTVTLPFVVGSVVNTDTDANLVIWNSAGSQVIIKNRLGSSKTVCYKTEYKQ